MSGSARHDGHDELAARRRASWGRRDDEHEETQSHAGNGIVNHGPEEQGPTKGQGLEGRGPDDTHGPDGPDGLRSDASGTDASGSGTDHPGSGTDGVAGTGGSGSSGSGSSVSGSDDRRSMDLGPDSVSPDSVSPNGRGPVGFGSDELALRNLLHQAVAEIEPRDGTLQHLRRAVPARRARKRQAVVGMAAAALLMGTAVPALVHVSNSTGAEVNPSFAGHGSETQEGEGQSKGQSGGSGSSGGSSGGSTESGKGSGKDKDEKDKGESNGSTGTAPEASSTLASAAACTAAQLGGTASVGAPDSVGAVYGSFQVSNISDSSCTVAGAGAVSTTAQGAADATKISVVNHVAGDAAAALPDPSLSPTTLLLAPGSSYQVQFAWVPSEPCPSSGGDTTGSTSGGGEPTPDPTPTENGTGSTTTTSDGGNSVSTQMYTEDGVVDGSVLVSHTAEGGVGTFSTAVSNACAGVVYRTGLLTTS